MTETGLQACAPVDISDEDIFGAMKDISGYLDITPADCKEIYLKAYQHAITRLTRSTKAADIMTVDVAYVLESTPIKQVAQLMSEKRVSGVPVISDDHSVMGIISERDFLIAMGGGEVTTFMEVVAQCLHGGSCLAAPIRTKYAKDIMSSPAVTVLETTPVFELADLFSSHGINRVPVADVDGRLVGIVSREDLVKTPLLFVDKEFFNQDQRERPKT